MREIKFRAWFEMYQGKGPKMVYEGDVANLYLGRNINAVPGCIFLQYTGLKDKNGREIYEGDILARDETEDEGTFEAHSITDYGVVSWKNGAWWVDFPFTGEDLSLFDYGPDTGEIYTNIYESPGFFRDA